MSPLYLLCGICGRKQADGLLSRAAWGHLEANGTEARACPTCRAERPDWEAQLVASLNGRVGAVIPNGGAPAA